MKKNYLLLSGGFLASIIFATITFSSGLLTNMRSYEVLASEQEVVQEPKLVEPLIETSKIDVWDFGAEQLNTDVYNNKLSVEIINAWYAESVVPGTSGIVLPSFSAGDLGFIAGGNDRLRTTNELLSRFDQNVAGVTGYAGRVYVNSAAATGRYLTLNLNEDDQVTIIAKTDAGGNVVFTNQADGNLQTDEVAMTVDLAELNFVAKTAGVYRVYDSQGKPSYYRVYRKAANYIQVSGTADVSQAADIPSGYSIVFKNQAGKTWQALVQDNLYSANLPAGFSYELSLADANGYIISAGAMLDVTEATTNHNVEIAKINLFELSGNITGLGISINNLTLGFEANDTENSIFIPTALVSKSEGTYSVLLESGVDYTINATGVNDYYIVGSSVNINVDSQFDIVFAEKQKYNVTISTSGLTTPEEGALGLTFTNLYEEGYAYAFTAITDIQLRDGVYSVSATGLDNFGVELALTSNLVVDGADVSKLLTFSPVKNWPFNDMVITTSTTAYRGLEFNGTISNEIAKGHLVTKPAATIKVPVKVGEKVIVTYYYSADFSFDGGQSYTTSSNSTSLFENADFVYAGNDDGFVTITIGASAATTYLTNIAVRKAVAYKSVITVGVDKEYQSINDALAAVREMVRESNQRVTVMIDPGNYEEMLVVDMPNITLKNASNAPGIALLNSGVDIETEAVRITSYYGHGYNYYSMTSNQKWNADVLRVNKENGYLSYNNVGSGTSNGSFWNATVVVSAMGFEADHIIFENSFNQYISQKEADDVVVMWQSGSKGLRPVNFGNTAVQDKSFIERAAAIAFTGAADKTILNNCRVVGRQDSFFGAAPARVVVYKGEIMGGTDFIFGGMTAVFYKSDIVMNTSDASTDVSYITAAQQAGGRGYLMYECNVRSAVPGIENASTNSSKPGYFGRPWAANTSEVVFFKTTIQASQFPGAIGKSLIIPVGWLSSLGGESPFMYEFGTVELSGENNTPSRASWSTVLTEPILNGAIDINTFNFTKGNDSWDPIPALIDNETSVPVVNMLSQFDVNIFVDKQQIHVSNINQNTTINVYSTAGTLVNSFKVNADTNFRMAKGVYIVNVVTSNGQKSIKVVVF